MIENIIPQKKVLNVGGYSKNISIPDCFSSWQHDLLDIDPSVKPDILCDARELWRLPSRVYDAIYCSHNLEHYFYHDLPKVLKGFKMILKKEGFAYIEVPNVLFAMKGIVEQGKEFEDIAYESSVGPILFRDVIYGSHLVIEKNKGDFMIHKNGFTETSLTKALLDNGFSHVYTNAIRYTIVAVAFNQNPTKWQVDLLDIKQ